MEERCVPLGVLAPALECAGRALAEHTLPRAVFADERKHALALSAPHQPAQERPHAEQPDGGDAHAVDPRLDGLGAHIVRIEPEAVGQRVADEARVPRLGAVAENMARLVVEGGGETRAQRRFVAIGALAQQRGDLIGAVDRLEIVGVDGDVWRMAYLALGDVHVVAVAEVGRPFDHAPFVQILQEEVLLVVGAVGVQQAADFGIVLRQIVLVAAQPVVPQDQRDQHQRIFGDFLHEGAVQTGDHALGDERRGERVVDQLTHDGIVPRQHQIGQRRVAAVAHIEALFALHAVLNDLLHAVFLRGDAQLPDRAQALVSGRVRIHGRLEREGIVPRPQSDVCNGAALGQRQLGVAEGLVIEPVQSVALAGKPPRLLVIAVGAQPPAQRAVVA